MTRRKLWNLDLKLLIPTLVLLIISLSTLYTINVSYFKTQLIFGLLSVFAFLIFNNVNYKIIQLYKIPIYILSVILLLLVLFLGIESRGSIRWIDIFGFRIQFSEILKPFLTISFAAYLSELRQYSFRNLLLILLYIFPIAFLIFLQPDLGNAMLYIFVVILSLIFLGFPLRYFAGGFIFALATIPLFWRFLHDYQKQRILTFLNPSHDPLGTSYNAIQSIITVGSGMILGKGLGQGTQSGLSFLPEMHTDFIFATISEDLGFIGNLLILTAFVFILHRLFIIFQSSDDKFCRLFSGIAFINILVQLFVNIGMNIGILPIVGVTLPFVSYGGSSLLSNFILLGLASAIAKNFKANQVIEIR
ncbi:MAG: rod shape-determining protein RodA [Candidatus Levybacteria bacterium CG_4_10_14_0_2_um_filter_35_8]|nr:MAG: rod shape-determining protein RodA [Candidatus Levybacteria bacterium CG_4_10_14_0_2_um_filter_35_8]